MNNDDLKNKKPEGGEVILTGHLAQIYGDWMRTNKGTTPPLYRDQDGNPVWLNRKERRARAKQARSRK